MRIHKAGVGWLVAMALAAAAQAAVVGVYPVAGQSPDTIVFRDYNGGTDQNVSYNPGGASSPTQAIAGGVSAWTYGVAVSDPKIIYNDGNGTWDHASYPWVRMRYSQSRGGAGSVYVWENPAQGCEGVAFGQSTALTEGHGNPDSTVASPTTPNGSGYRIDGVGAAVANDVFAADYVLMDRFETLGLGEWDAAGDLNGWTVANAAGVNVANGVLSGTSTGDTMMNSTTLINTDLYTFIEIGLSTASTTPTETQLFWGPNGAFAEARSVKFSGTAGELITYVLNMSGEPTWTGTNMRIRLDPVQGDEAFAVDYIRLRTATSVPEPATMSLLVLGGLGLLARRRRGRDA